MKSELEYIKTHSSSVSGGGGSGGNGGGDFSESDFSKSASDSSVTIIYPPSMKSKIKSKQKIQARERATTAVANILKTISKATIFAVDLDVSLLKRTFLGCADVSVDELWKSSISSASSSQKEYLSEVRDHVKKANRDGVRSSIWIFSTNDNSAFLVSV